MTDKISDANGKGFVMMSAIPQPWRAIVEDLSSRNKNLDAEVERLLIALETAQRSADEWLENFRALEKAVVGDTGLSAITVAREARTYKTRVEALEAEVERLQIALANGFPGTLRDWFAGQALAGLIPGWRSTGPLLPDYAARLAYAGADSMLAARAAALTPPSSEESKA